MREVYELLNGVTMTRLFDHEFVNGDKLVGAFEFMIRECVANVPYEDYVDNYGEATKYDVLKQAFYMRDVYMNGIKEYDDERFVAYVSLDVLFGRDVDHVADYFV